MVVQLGPPLHDQLAATAAATAPHVVQLAPTRMTYLKIGAFYFGQLKFTVQYARETLVLSTTNWNRTSLIGACSGRGHGHSCVSCAPVDSKTATSLQYSCMS